MSYPSTGFGYPNSLVRGFSPKTLLKCKEPMNFVRGSSALYKFVGKTMRFYYSFQATDLFLLFPHLLSQSFVLHLRNE